MGSKYINRITVDIENALNDYFLEEGFELRLGQNNNTQDSCPGRVVLYPIRGQEVASGNGLIETVTTFDIMTDMRRCQPLAEGAYLRLQGFDPESYPFNLLLTSIQTETQQCRYRVVIRSIFEPAGNSWLLDDVCLDSRHTTQKSEEFC